MTKKAATKTNKIDIGIPEKSRREIAEGLSRLLADTFTLYLTTHNFHWNVTGPQFQTLHLMFETQYNELWTATDEVAERIRALAEHAPGTYADFTELTSLTQPKGVPNANEMIRQLVHGHEQVAKTARSVMPAAEEGHDEATVDMLVGRLQHHEKTAWMLRSMLE